MLMQLHILALISEARPPKPQTTVFAEQYGIRERHASELIHLHDSDTTTCKVCGTTGFMVWTDSMDKFAQHVNRCGELPAVEVSLT